MICPLGHLQIESSKKKNRHCPQPLLKEELPLLVKACIPDAFMTYRLVILLLWNLCLVNREDHHSISGTSTGLLDRVSPLILYIDLLGKHRSSLPLILLKGCPRTEKWNQMIHLHFPIGHIERMLPCPCSSGKRRHPCRTSFFLFLGPSRTRHRRLIALGYLMDLLSSLW